MPSLRQILFWIYIHSEAKLSISLNSPCHLWHKPSLREINNMLTLNWYDFHQIYTLTFLVDSIEEKKKKFPLVLSFFFLNPRWYLVNEFDAQIKKCWEKALEVKTPSILINLDNTPTAISWHLLKQNDPDLLRLIIRSINQNKIFIPPFTNLILTPLGVTPPIVKPAHFTPKRLNLDPTSSSKIKGGHNALFRSYATAVDF